MAGHVISTTMKPSTNWTKIHYSSPDSGVELVYEIGVVCDVNYYGNCSVYCVPRDDRLGHWTCAEDTGSRLCLPGWRGTHCVIGVYQCQCQYFEPPLDAVCESFVLF